MALLFVLESPPRGSPSGGGLERFAGSRWKKGLSVFELMWPCQSGPEQYSGKLIKIRDKMSGVVFLKSQRGMTAN